MRGEKRGGWAECGPLGDFLVGDAPLEAVAGSQPELLLSGLQPLVDLHTATTIALANHRQHLGRVGSHRLRDAPEAGGGEEGGGADQMASMKALSLSPRATSSFGAPPAASAGRELLIRSSSSLVACASSQHSTAHTHHSNLWRAYWGGGWKRDLRSHGMPW